MAKVLFTDSGGEVEGGRGRHRLNLKIENLCLHIKIFTVLMYAHSQCFSARLSLEDISLRSSFGESD